MRTESANRTTGETEGVNQEPTEVGDSDATQREQAAREGDAPINDPSAPKSDGDTGTGSAGQSSSKTNQGRT
jgi:hypothetical protein